MRVRLRLLRVTSLIIVREKLVLAAGCIAVVRDLPLQKAVC